MPIRIGANIKRLDDEQSAACVYEVMRHVFDVHREFGRLFQEKIYHRELAFRLANAECEVPIELEFEEFRKTYYLDLLVDGGVIVELKAVELLAETHRRQLLNYLFFTGLPHGKLVNFRRERVDHEYVNNTLDYEDRTGFSVVEKNWVEIDSAGLMDRIIALLRDWGTGLNLELYEEAAAHMCGQPPDEEAEVEIWRDSRSLGMQCMRLAAPGVALRITALPANRQENYVLHLSRLLEYAERRAVQWVNVTRHQVQFATIPRK